jgi:hypothetical protein
MSRRHDDWIIVFSCGTDYEADLVRDRLDDSGIPAVVLTQRDHAFNLNVGDLSDVHVLVQPEREEDALALIEERIPSDEELERAALDADPDAPSAHDDKEEAQLDSGNETIAFPEAEDEDRDA